MRRAPPLDARPGTAPVLEAARRCDAVGLSYLLILSYRSVWRGGSCLDCVDRLDAELGTLAIRKARVPKRKTCPLMRGSRNIRVGGSLPVGCELAELKTRRSRRNGLSHPRRIGRTLEPARVPPRSS